MKTITVKVTKVQDGLLLEAFFGLGLPLMTMALADELESSDATGLLRDIASALPDFRTLASRRKPGQEVSWSMPR